MAVYRISGNKELFGTVEISAAKNAVLPVIFASILTAESVIIDNVPLISDVLCALEIINELGGICQWTGDSVRICGESMHAGCIMERAQKMRASVLCLLMTVSLRPKLFDVIPYIPRCRSDPKLTSLA